MSNIDIFRGLGVEVNLPDEESFLKIKETLTRIGIASRKENKLFQSCHILHKQGRYSIFHFKELFVLDGKKTDISEDDILRRNTIADLLDQWGLVVIIDPEKYDDKMPLSYVKIIPFKEKQNWVLEQKYTLGKNKF